MMPTPPRYVGPDKAFGAAVRTRVHAHFTRSGTSQKATPRLVSKVVIMLALFLAPLVVILAVDMPAWTFLAMSLLMGIGMAGVGMGVMHDALHGATSRHRWVNELLGATMYLLGSDALTWKVQHNGAHHTHTNVDEIDQDIDPPDLLRFSEHAPLWRAHRFQFIYAFFFYGLLTIVKLGNDFFSLARLARLKDPKYKEHHFGWHFAGMVGVKLAHLFLFIGLPLLLTDLPWWLVVSGFLLMHFTCGVILGTVFQLAHVVEGAQQPLPDADGVIATDWAVHELLTTANFAPRSALVTWYTGGLNFQIEHHLFPYISHLHYPAIAPIVIRTAEEFGVPYNVKPTLASAVGSHIRRLQELGRSAVHS